jgi:hypothetical protein
VVQTPGRANAAGVIICRIKAWTLPCASDGKPLKSTWSQRESNPPGKVLSLTGCTSEWPRFTNDPASAGSFALQC